MARKLKHSKIKNTSILFELLTRQITADVLAGKSTKSVKIVKKYFNEDTELGKELQLYRLLSEKHYESESRANDLINIVLKSRQKISNSKLRNEKYNLIKEIKSHYDLNFFLNSKISNYKQLASIFTLMEGYNSLSPVDSDQLISSKLNLIGTIGWGIELFVK